MMTVICVFIAFAFGLLLFAELQDKLPPELEFLRVTPSATAASQSLSSGVNYKGWFVTQSPENQAIELKRSWEGSNEQGGLGVLCAQGVPSVLLTRRGVREDEIIVKMGPLPPSSWFQAAGGGYVPDPTKVPEVLRLIAASKGFVSVKIQSSGGKEIRSIDSTGFADLYSQFPASCK